MRRNHQAVGARAQPGEVVERARGLGGGRRIVEEKHVPPRDCALDARHEHDATRARVREQVLIHKLPFVQRERERVKTRGRGTVDKRDGGVFDVVYGIFGGVKVKVDFEHVSSLRRAPT